MNTATTTAPIASRLADLARRVENNVPDHRRPESFHAEKSEIVQQMREIAREART